MSSSTIRRPIVLLYHRLGSPLVRSTVRGQYVLPALFRRHIRTLLDLGYRGASLPELVFSAEHYEGRFCVTFDDGYASVAKVAMPILVELAVPTTVFVVVGAVGKSNFWDEAKGDRHEPTLSLSELRDLAAAGLEIGSHSMTHAWLTDLDNGELQKEVGDSKRALEDMLGKKVAAFSYPYGAWDARVREAVVGAGYGYATTTTLAALTSTTDPFAIPRVNIRWNTFGPLLVRKIARAYRQS